MAALADTRGAGVFTTTAIHTSDILSTRSPVVARRLGVEGSTPKRTGQLRIRFADDDPEISAYSTICSHRRSAVEVLNIRPSPAAAAHRLVQRRSLARTSGALCDWDHTGSRSQRVDSGRLSGRDQTKPLMVLITYRPEYRAR